ncbi:LssY C-terminal domain-containing protein [Rathayibacter soli]|uniref:LssY C-terminal domain-containing protein n=1 Tax=Rathayibacter soli TaxID=3144168 RepID=UPI0027E4C174|nr:LssY C-terminal domain-containing protein [Glaciibacter superstes]
MSEQTAPEPTKVSALPLPRGRVSVNVALDYAFFIFAGAAAIWLAWLVLSESFSWGWWQIVFFVLFWLVLAYLILPRLHRILTRMYVPNYFIGRARTSDGLLGDPINLALLGSEEQLNLAMRDAGWTRADDVTFASSWRIVTSTITRRSYDEAPVSPLMLFEKQQDVAYQQEVLGNPAKRHHVRFWRCPDGWLLPGGHQTDWLAAGTFDRSVGFSLFTLQITHKIDANTDIERDHIVNTLTTSDEAIDVRVIRDFSTGYHSRNGGGDTIVTDGDLPVIDLRALPVPPTDPDAAPAADPTTKRPVQIIFGSLLMLFRILAGIIAIVSVLVGWGEFVRSSELEVSGLTPDEVQQIAALILTVVVGIAGGAVLIYLALIILVFRGSNWARIAAMVFGAIVIIAAFVDAVNGGPRITLFTTLPGLAFDILVMLALSSERARVWSRLPHGRRARARAARKAARAADRAAVEQPGVPSSP